MKEKVLSIILIKISTLKQRDKDINSKHNSQKPVNFRECNLLFKCNRDQRLSYRYL